LAARKSAFQLRDECLLHRRLFYPLCCSLAALLVGSFNTSAPARHEEAGSRIPRTVVDDLLRVVVLSPDGKWFATSSYPSATIRLWDAATGRQTAVLKIDASIISSAVASPDGKKLFVATEDDMRVWDVATGKQSQRILAGVQFGFEAASFSDDRSKYISTSMKEGELDPDGKHVSATIKVWDVPSGKEEQCFKFKQSTAVLLTDFLSLLGGVPRNEEVMGTAISPNGKWVVAGTRRGFVRRWDAVTGKEARSFGSPKDWTASPLGFTKDGKWLATSVLTVSMLRKTDSVPVIRLWDVATGEAKHQIDNAGSATFSQIFSDDGKWLLTGRDESTVRIWDVDTAKEIRAFTAGKRRFVSCRLSNDKKVLATCDDGGEVRLWHAATGEQFRKIQACPISDRSKSKVVLELLFTQDFKSMIAWHERRLTLWNLESGKPIQSIEVKDD
jgi:WD40 repeat protein